MRLGRKGAPEMDKPLVWGGKGPLQIGGGSGGLEHAEASRHLWESILCTGVLSRGRVQRGQGVNLGALLSGLV